MGAPLQPVGGVGGVGTRNLPELRQGPQRVPQVHDDTVLEVASSASNPVPSTFVLPAAGMPATSVHALWSGREVEGGGRRAESGE